MKVPLQCARSFVIVAGMALLLAACKRRDNDLLTPPPVINPVNDAISVSASVFGIVLDENNLPLAGATVSSGPANTTTNANGGFYFNNILLSKENGSVTVTKQGYFTAVRSFKTTANKEHIVRIQMMQKTLSGSVQAVAGGTVNLNAGASIIFPAAAFVTLSGAAYSGTVNIYARALDPLAPNLPLIIPGDLRGIDSTGTEAMLKTFGMIGAELQDPSGNVLKLAPGKTAGISFPIPAALATSAPVSIPLWHFDNTTARWKQDGTGSKVNGKYIAQVNKFSFWNFDLGRTGLVNIDFTLLNNGVPLVGAMVKISFAAAADFYKVSITNSDGFTDGYVPANEPLVLEVISPECNTPSFSLPIGPFSANTSLGTIAVNVPLTKYINFTGNIKNCTGAAVSNGSISLYGSGGQFGFAHTNSLGNFSFTVMNCASAPVNYIYAGTDISTNIQSAVQSVSAVSGNVNLGSITACAAVQTGNVYIAGYIQSTGSSGNNLVTVWKNGIPSQLTDGSKNAIGKAVYVSGNDVYTVGNEVNINTGSSIGKAWKNGQLLYSFGSVTAKAEANDIVVSGGDIYIAGFSGGPVVWKNGVAMPLEGTGVPVALAVSGTDVYAAGRDAAKGVAWKNGVKILTASFAEFASIFISGSDVYVGGWYSTGNNHFATYWKNGVAVALTSGVDNAAISAIYVSGADVYAVGNVTTTNFIQVAKIWKNGVATILADGVSNVGYVSDVQVIGNDVYVVGTKRVPGPVVPGAIIYNYAIVLWKNNLPTLVTDGSVTAIPSSLFIN